MQCNNIFLVRNRHQRCVIQLRSDAHEPTGSCGYPALPSALGHIFSPAFFLWTSSSAVSIPVIAQVVHQKCLLQNLHRTCHMLSFCPHFLGDDDTGVWWYACQTDVVGNFVQIRKVVAFMSCSKASPPWLGYSTISVTTQQFPGVWGGRWVWGMGRGRGGRGRGEGRWGGG